MPNTPLEPKDIIKLIGELKDETPEYPTHLMSNRKAAFLQKAIDIKVSKEGDSSQGGQKGGQSGLGGVGSSGAAMRDKTFFLGLSLKQILTIGIVLVLLVAAYFLRNQISEVLDGNNDVNAGETSAPSNSYRLDTPTKTPTPKPIVGAPVVDPENEHSIVENPESTAKVPGKGTGQGTGPEAGAPTPGTRRDLGSAFKFLFCILGLGGESCD